MASVCALLGLDPLYVACEGRLVAIVAGNDAQDLLSIMRRHSLGKNAQVIGSITHEHNGRVIMKSHIGGRRILDKLSGEQLPRIC